MLERSATAQNRRKSQRQYLAHRVPVELIHGSRRFSIASAWICDLSSRGIGLRSAQTLALKPGTPITLATTCGEQVLTVPGRIVSARHGQEFGIEADTPEARDSLRAIAETADSVAVTSPDQGRSRISGRVSMAARHPVQWAINGGATCIDMTEATEIDSSGLGLLLLLNERCGLSIEGCPEGICRTIGLVSLSRLCAADCPRRRSVLN